MTPTFFNRPKRYLGNRASALSPDPLAVVGAVLLITIIGIALFAPLLTSFEPSERAGLPFQEPSELHWLGTDDLGHDIFSQLLFGARLSLLIGFLSAGLALIVALAVALTAAYAAGWPKIILLRLVDVTLSFPFLPLAILLAAFLGRELGITIATISLVLWARPALILTPQAAKVATFQHVIAAEAMGATPRYILIRHMLPRLMPLAIAQFVRAANVAIFLEAALAFLGLGDPNRISWGTMLFFANSSSAMLTDAWKWWILPVGLALTLTIVALALLGFGIERWADPRLRGATAPLAGKQQTGKKESQSARRELSNDENYPAKSELLLQIRNLSIRYKAKSTERTPLVVKSVSLDIKQGEVVGLIGPSGCGKSSLAMTLLRLQLAPSRETTGEIKWNGQSLFSLPLETIRGRELTLIPQNAMNALNPVYTIHKQLLEVAQLRPELGSPQDRVPELLSLVGIPADRHTAYPHELSGGMRQRVVIAMAVINRPQLVIADEPTTGLDRVTQIEILTLILDLKRRFKMAMLLISHDLALVGQAADQLYVMDAGEIVDQGAAAAVLGRNHHSQFELQLASELEDGDDLQENKPLVHLDQVSKAFGNRRSIFSRHNDVMALNSVTLTLAPGEIVSLVGQSGAGKSTLARLILGLEQPDHGSLNIGGTDMSSLSRRSWRQSRREMHLILQDPYQSLHPGMKVGRLVAEPLMILNRTNRSEQQQKVLEALEAVGLTPAAEFVDRFPHQLSGGQRQRVALARAMIGQPKLIIADEPTSMLDPSLQAVILGLIDRIRQEKGSAVLLITHDLNVASSISDRIGVMQAGCLVEIGKTADLIKQPQHPYTQELIGMGSEVQI